MTTITVGRPAMPTTCVSTAAPSAPVLSCGAVAAPRTCTPTGTSDGWIAHDFGCVLNVARPENGAALTQYRKMRMAVPGFKLGEFDPAKANSDRAVIAQWRQWLAANRPTRAPMPDPAQVDQWCTCNRCLFQRRDTGADAGADRSTIQKEPALPTRRCANGACGRDISDKRPSARTCSPRCRQVIARTPGLRVAVSCLG
jgi:hypothetical protein